MIHRITAKAASLEDIKEKKKCGADTIEWQIVDKKHNTSIAPECMEILPITSIHTALGDHCATDIDNYYESDYVTKEKAEWTKKSLREACHLAEYCAGYQNFPVKVVVHLRNQICSYPYIDYALIIEDLLITYPNIEICFENVPAFKENGCSGTNAYPGTVSTFARNIRMHVAKPLRERIGVVLDICHMLNTVRGLNLLKAPEGLPYVSDIDGIEEFFKKDGDLAKIIHFNNSRLLGIKSINHSIGFRNDILFRAALSFVDEYTNNPDLVLELREDDYGNCINFKETAALVRKVENDEKCKVTTIFSKKYNTEFRLSYDRFGPFIMPTQNTNKNVWDSFSSFTDYDGYTYRYIKDIKDILANRN